MKSPTQTPLFEPDLGADEIAAITAVIESGWIAMGPKTQAFEQAFSDFLGGGHCIAVNSCTAALHLAYVMVGAETGKEVVVPSLTFSATANAVAYTGATPVFADVISEDDWTIDPASVEALLGEKTAAVACMHYAGFPCDIPTLMTLCEGADIPLIEDACHGLGGSFGNLAMGRHGAIGCFSFYSNKAITTAEGGMLITDNEEFAARAKLLRSHGMTATAYDRERGSMGYDIEDLGWNYRLDDIRASIGSVQLAKLPAWAEAKKTLVKAYCDRLKDIPGVRVPRFGGRGDPAHYILPIAVEGVNRDAVRQAMQDAGVQTSIHYPPTHLFSHYEQQRASLPVTEWVAAHTLTLPLYPTLTLDQVERVCDTLAGAIRKAKARP